MALSVQRISSLASPVIKRTAAYGINLFAPRELSVPIREFGVWSSIRERFNTKKKPLYSKEQELAVEVQKKPFLQRKWDQWSGRLALESEISDLYLLEKFVGLSATLIESDFPSEHPAQSINARCKSLIKEMWSHDNDVVVNIDKVSKVRKVLQEISQLMSEEQKIRQKDIENYVDLVKKNAGARSREWIWDSETALRLSVFQLYSAKLLNAIEDGSLSVDTLNDEAVISNIVEVFLVGTSQQRLTEHLRLYGQKIGQAQLQDAFYCLYDPEVAAVSSALTIVNGLHKDHIKGVPKFASTYLLDRLELSVKSRCVFCFSDPSLDGVKPPGDDHTISVEQLLESRAEYFEDGVEIGHLCASAIAADRRAHYVEREDTRGEVRKGALFFLACCTIDAILTNG